MPTTIKSLSGIGAVQAGEGVGPISSWSGAVGGPVTSVIFRATQRDVINIASTITVAPNAGGINGSYNGSPSLNPDTGEYDLSVAAVFTYNPTVPFPNRWSNVVGSVDFPDGIEATDMTGVGSQDIPFDFEAHLGYKDPTDPDDWLNPGPSDTSNIDHVESDTLDGLGQPTGDKDETFTWDLPVEDLAGTIIQRSDNGGPVTTIASLGPSVVTYVDTLTPGNSYVYTFYNYYVNGDGISGPITYPPEPIVPDGPPAVIPLIDITMVGEIDFGGAPSIAMIVNPSGIYGLIPNLTHDVLYERVTGITSVNVKIPDPFAKTGFLPED